VLQVAVHHQHPVTVRGPGTGHHRTTQPTAPLLRPAMQQPHRYRAPRRVPEYRRRRVVVAVVHDENLGRQRSDRRTQAVQQRLDVVGLIPGGHEHGQPQRVAGKTATATRLCVRVLRQC
jgi:hypothetical protein